jgi:hypothetical protein
VWHVGNERKPGNGTSWYLMIPHPVRKKLYIKHCEDVTKFSTACFLHCSWPLGNINSPLGNINSPLGNINSPLGYINSPLGNINSPLGNINSPLGNINSPLGNINSPLVT